jgi:hypothetical protein
MSDTTSPRPLVNCEGMPFVVVTLDLTKLLEISEFEHDVFDNGCVTFMTADDGNGDFGPTYGFLITRQDIADNLIEVTATYIVAAVK